MPTNDERFLTDLLVEQIVELDPGDLITYSEMSALAGVDVQFEHRNILDKAMMIARENYNVVLENKRNVGYERLSDEDVINRLKEIDKIRRTSTRGREKLATVSYESLDPILKGRHNAKFILLTVFGNLSNNRVVESIEAKIGSTEVVINIQKALEIVSGSTLKKEEHHEESSNVVGDGNDLLPGRYGI